MVPLRRAGERQRGAILFPRKENSPPYTPQEKGTRGLPPRPRTLAVCSLKSCTRCAIRCGVHGFAMNPCESLRLATAPYYREARVTFARRRTARGVAAFGVAIRFASAPTTRCCSAYLVGVRTNFRLPPVSTMRRAKQCRYFARSLPPSKRHSRLTIVRRG